MIPGTHLLIADIVYNYILRKLKFELDYSAFSYGNIMPDLNKGYISHQHTLEDSGNIINRYSEALIRTNTSMKDFSRCLGVVCHFVCDYFCLQHTKEYWRKDYIAHGIYEISLHKEFLRLCRNDGIKINYKCKKEKNIIDIIMKLQKKYVEAEKGMTTDIIYSVIAAAAVSESIVSRVKAKLL